MKKTAVKIGLALAAGLAFRAGAAEKWTAIATGRADYQIWRGDDQLFGIELQVIGPGWTRPDQQALSKSEGGRRVYAETLGFKAGRGGDAAALRGVAFDIRYEASQPKPDALAISTRTLSKTDAEAIGVGAIVSTTDFFAGGEGSATQEDGTSTTFSMPLGMGRQGDRVTSIVLTAKTGERVKIAATRPLKVTSDRGELRIWLWADKIAAGAAQDVGLTFEFPDAISVETANRLVDMKDWIEFRPRQDFAPGSPIGAEGWLDAPAGKHGWVQLDGPHFVFEKQKKPFKFWGANIAFARMAVEPEFAAEWAAKFAKYGVNIVRMHKWTGHNGWDGVMRADDPMAFDEEPTRRFDNMHAELKKRGIYVGWSTIFALKADEKMTRYIPNMPEIRAAIPKRGSGLFTNSLYPLQTFATDIQDYFIALTVKWLERTNTVTGLRYADDPAVAYVELHNEADIFFPGTGKLLQLYPTYTRQMNERFAAWLAKRYADDAALKAAWGNDLKKNESLAQKNIFPFPNYGGQMPAPRRVVDSYTFLFEYQNEFYERYTAAIRKTGYKGAIVGGCWQAADMYGHLLNIASDRRAGFIDRHNYGGGEMLSKPGSGLLSAGMQHVGDRPFGLTEWAPGAIWGAQCQPIIGLVGLGVQGWDYSAQFASGGSIVLTDNTGGINGNFDELRAIAQHPFIGRLLYSGALKEGENVASRRISMEELYAGQVGFQERFSLLGGANVKAFEGSVPNEALAAGRVTIDFVDKPADVKVEMSKVAPYWDPSKRIVRASNGQVVWNYGGRGFITADTPAGGAVIGFGGGRDHVLSGAVIRYENPFANVYVVARKPGQTLADADEAIVLTMARTANRGDVYEETYSTPLVKGGVERKARGAGPAREEYMASPTLIVEPVRATVSLPGARPFRVFALDHDGCRPAPPVEVPVVRTPQGGQFALDGARYKTMYYLVRFER